MLCDGMSQALLAFHLAPKFGPVHLGCQHGIDHLERSVDEFHVRFDQTWVSC